MPNNEDAPASDGGRIFVADELRSMICQTAKKDDRFEIDHLIKVE